MAPSVIVRLAWLPLAACFCGCTDDAPLGQVEGVVRLRQQPLAQVQVTFLPDPDQGGDWPRSTAITDEHGRYVLRTDDQRQGAALGWHFVVVEDLWLDVPVIAKGSDEEDLPARTRPAKVPATYASAKSTPVKVEVKPGSQQIDLNLMGK